MSPSARVVEKLMLAKELAGRNFAHGNPATTGQAVYVKLIGSKSGKFWAGGVLPQ